MPSINPDSSENGEIGRYNELYRCVDPDALAIIRKLESVDPIVLKMLSIIDFDHKLEHEGYLGSVRVDWNQAVATSSKIRKLLLLLEDMDSVAAKSLIFSQYTSTLEWLQQELPKHGFQFRTLTGTMSMKKSAKALHDFQKDPPTTVFLLSMR